MSNIKTRLDNLKLKFLDENFLKNKGLANEVGIYVFSYEGKNQPVVDYFFRQIEDKLLDISDNEDKNIIKIKNFDLYEIFLELCEEKRISSQIPKMEEKKGSKFLLEQLTKVFSPELFVEKMDQYKAEENEIIIISGVGKVFPFMRSHKILNNIQHIFEDNPVVMLYPGKYNGQRLDLFGEFIDDNYYRAFNLI